MYFINIDNTEFDNPLKRAYPIEYHIKAFEKILSLLNGHVNKITISFLDEYKNFTI